MNCRGKIEIRFSLEVELFLGSPDYVNARTKENVFEENFCRWRELGRVSGS